MTPGPRQERAAALTAGRCSKGIRLKNWAGRLEHGPPAFHTLNRSKSMKSVEKITMTCNGHRYVVSTPILARGTPHKTVLWCLVEECDGLKRTPPAREAFAYEATTLPAHIKARLEADLLAGQAEQAAARAAIRESMKSRNTHPSDSLRGDRVRTAKKAAIARSKLEALFSPDK